MRLYVVPLLTELIRMLIFYRSKLVPDIALSSKEDILQFQSQIMVCVNLIKTNHTSIFGRWRENLINTSNVSLHPADTTIHSESENLDQANTIKYILTVLSSLDNYKINVE